MVRRGCDVLLILAAIGLIWDKFFNIKSLTRQFQIAEQESKDPAPLLVIESVDGKLKIDTDNIFPYFNLHAHSDATFPITKNVSQL